MHHRLLLLPSRRLRGIDEPFSSGSTSSTKPTGSSIGKTCVLVDDTNAVLESANQGSLQTESGKSYASLETTGAPGRQLGSLQVPCQIFFVVKTLAPTCLPSSWQPADTWDLLRPPTHFHRISSQRWWWQSHKSKKMKKHGALTNAHAPRVPYVQWCCSVYLHY